MRMNPGQLRRPAPGAFGRFRLLGGDRLGGGRLSGFEPGGCLRFPGKTQVAQARHAIVTVALGLFLLLDDLVVFLPVTAEVLFSP